MTKPSVQDRLEKNSFREPNSGCWLWTACVNSKGYGRIGVGLEVHLAHRLSYETHIGPIPKGMCVCHKCDTPSCIRPDHLFLGTNLENRTDSVNKGRHPHGERAGHAKLTADQVLAIRKASGSYARVGAKFGITRSNVGHIKQGRRWKHLFVGASNGH